ncbi:hypothetical protein HOY80DRAFT_1138881 [Tuber brumale]|nr:hypothetical protein HOY80DRAFT_1138881 [Tuber brumale]
MDGLDAWVHWMKDLSVQEAPITRMVEAYICGENIAVSHVNQTKLRGSSAEQPIGNCECCSACSKGWSGVGYMLWISLFVGGNGAPVGSGTDGGVSEGLHADYEQVGALLEVCPSP